MGNYALTRRAARQEECDKPREAECPGEGIRREDRTDGHPTRLHLGNDWAAGTRRFGTQLVLIGFVAFLLALPHPDAGWKAIIAMMGVTTMMVGWWHRRNAEAINRLGMEREARDLQEAE